MHTSCNSYTWKLFNRSKQKTYVKKFFTTLTVFICSYAFAQQKGSISGVIVNEQNNELSRITVQLQGLSMATATDENGQFVLSHVPAGNYTLLVSGIGFQAKKENISVQEGKTTTITLQLNTAKQTLQEVVVRSRRVPGNTSSLTRTNTPLKDIPQSIQIIDRVTLTEQQTFKLDEALKNVAGVNNASYFGSFNYRGFVTNVQSTLTNGIKGSPYPEGVLPLMGNVERVEVIHGPSAILYGQGALGGTMNLVTKQPKKNTVVNGTIGAGSFNLFRAMADITGSINKKKTLYFLAGVAGQTGGRFTKGYDNNNLQVYGSLRWDINARTYWQVNVNYVYDRATDNWQSRIPLYKDSANLFLVPHDFNYAGSDSRYRGSSYQIQSILEHTLSTSWKLGLLIGQSESRADRIQYSLSGYVNPANRTVGRTFTRQELNSPQTTVNAYTTGSFKTWKLKHQLTAGGDVMLSRSLYPNGIRQFAGKNISIDNPVDSPFVQEGAPMYYYSDKETFTYNVLGAYVQEQIEILPQLKLLAGLRYNNYFMRYRVPNISYDMVTFEPYEETPLRTESFTPRAGLVYQPFKTLSVYIDYNEGFSPQYGNSKASGGPFDPETSRQYEFGIKGDFLKGSFQPSVAIYQNTKHNVLKSANDPNNPALRVAVGEVRSRGIELAVTGYLAERIHLIANYSYNDTRITESTRADEIGQIFDNAPNNMANGWASYAFGSSLKGLKIGAGAQYTSKRYVAFKKLTQKVVSLPEYTVCDAMISYSIRQYTLQANINNLFDERYAVNGNVNAFTPGMPRNFLVTVSCSFK